MSIAFDRDSLSSAAKLIVAIARTKNQKQIFNPVTSTMFDLSDVQQVTEYLMDYVEDLYKKAELITPGLIVGVPYFSIGVVFEDHPGEMTPPSIFRGVGTRKHLAIFWQTV